MLLPLLLLSCGSKEPPADPVTAAPAEGPVDCVAFVEEADRRYLEVSIQAEVAAWASETNLTPETEAVAAEAWGALMDLNAELAEAVRPCLDQELDPRTARMVELIRRGGGWAAPEDPAEAEELARISTELGSHYGKAKVCEGEQCQTLDDLSAMMSSERDYDTLLAAWVGWRDTAKAQKDRYARFAELSNKGAVRGGYADVGAAWRSGYDMPPDDFVAEMDRLWDQVRPLYEQLHCYTRAQLVDEYGAERVDPAGPIPAHLLGNMWAQDWSNLNAALAPYPDEPSIDLTPALESKGWTPEQMVEAAEGFFTSMGMVELPETFWERSMFVRPEDREVVCHASAWDPTWSGDVRIKMCIRPTHEDLLTIHHELGHDYYFLYYKDLPALFRQGAHDGFHEAIGDTLLLSATPAYFQGLGLLDEVSATDEGVLNSQMLAALDDIAFLPFGLLIDRWRWAVFSGEVGPEQYNEAWWELRERYQGVAAPVERPADAFDPGAKYHIPANTPYSRYFLSTILQYQFHQALCDAAGHEGPLHTCSVAGSQEAGERFAAMLSMGASEPWQDALEALAGTRQMDAGPMVEYFQPLSAWLEEQNAERECGW
ncbi:MAG: M2 family metallopeptidase [Alphaproteobacteria bacterium]|nr:M2 family metallopeptidase [Alphaproteobacteria bacterium]